MFLRQFPVRLWIVLIFLPSTSLLVGGRKLSTEENERNAKRCGVHFLGEGSHSGKRLSKRSFGGRQFEPNEFPWTVIVKLREGFCSGVQISPRHVLTVAHCVVDYDLHFNELQCSLNRSYSAVSVMSDPRDLSVYIGINKEDPNKGSASEPFKAVLNVSKITVHDFDFCDAYNDLALIELSQNVTESASVPICMPSEDLQLHRVLYASGAGMDPASPKTLADPYQLARGQQVVAQKFYAVEDLWHMILTQTFSKLPMPGDAGGPLFQVDESEIHTLVGIACCGDDEWKSDIGENYRAAYVDVRAYLDWICKYSGVCPLEDASLEEKLPNNLPSGNNGN